jgi:hypothetical protein
MELKKFKTRIVSGCMAAIMAAVSMAVAPVNTIVASATQTRTSIFYGGYKLRGIGAQDIVAVAMAQVNRTEADMGYTEAWCADFVTDCAILAGQQAIIPKDGYVPTLKDKVNGSRVSSPQAGDLVIYGDDDHIGIMINATQAVEGNTSDMVKIQEVSRWSHYFIRPNYIDDPYWVWPYANKYEQMMFDADFYSSKYADLKKAYGTNEKNLYRHWRENGIREGRAASIYFDPQYYSENNAAIKNKFGKNYTAIHQHFVNTGYNQKFKFSPVLDLKYYGENHKALKNKTAAQLLEHFYSSGVKSGLAGSAEFSPQKYKKRYSDLSKAFGNAWYKYYKHYLTYGIKEKRNGK